MQRIVILSAFYDPFISGAERMVKEVVERLQDRYCFIIITARLTRRSQKSEVRSYNFKIVRIGFGYKFDKFLYPLLAPFYVLKYRPKIVHAVMESYAGIALFAYSYLQKILKSIIHNSSFLILTLQSGDLDLPEKQIKIPSWLWRLIHRAPNLVVSIGDSMARRAKNLGAKQVSIIPNGVDLNKIELILAKNILKEKNKIICVARLSHEKGIEYLINAMPKIIDQFPSATLVLVGDGPLRKSLEFRILNFEQKLKNSIIFLGNLSHEETLKEIAKSEALILPSLAEGMGIVLVEAQALGVPVIGTLVGGIPDVIRHEQTGLLVPSKDSSAITTAVARVFKDKELAIKMAVEAKTRLLKFDWTNIAEEYCKIYDSFLKSKT